MGYQFYDWMNPTGYHWKTFLKNSFFNESEMTRLNSLIRIIPIVGWYDKTP